MRRQRASRQGAAILGVCGGMQLLRGDIPGLGPLDLTTTLALEKITRRREAGWVDGGCVSGYQIRHDRTEAGPAAHVHLEGNLGWRQENVSGVYLHGLMENTPHRQQFLARLGWKGQAADWLPPLDSEIDHVSRKVAETGWFEKL